MLGRTSEEVNKATQKKQSGNDIEKAVSEGMNALEGLLKGLKKN